MPERDHRLPQQPVPLPGRSFLSSRARPFAQQLPRQHWAQGPPLGRDCSLSTRPRKGWVTTYKHWFLKDREMETPQWSHRVWGAFPQGLPPRKPLLHPLSAPQPASCPGLKETPISLAPLGAQGLLDAAFSGTRRADLGADLGAGGRVAAGIGSSGLPTPLGLQMAKCPAPEDAPRTGGEPQAQKEQAPNTGLEAAAQTPGA